MMTNHTHHKMSRWTYITDSPVPRSLVERIDQVCTQQGACLKTSDVQTVTCPFYHECDLDQIHHDVVCRNLLKPVRLKVRIKKMWARIMAWVSGLLGGGI